MEDNRKIKTLIGEVISTAGEKTCVVEVSRVKTNALYKKKYKVSKKYLVHDEKNEAQVGDQVEISPVRPISKNKSFKLLGKI